MANYLFTRPILATVDGNEETLHAIVFKAEAKNLGQAVEKAGLVPGHTYTAHTMTGTPRNVTIEEVTSTRVKIG